MIHLHQFGVCVGHRYHGQQTVPVTVSESRVEILDVRAGDTVVVQNTMAELESLLVSADQGDVCLPVTVQVGVAEFDLNRGPLQWAAVGHFADAIIPDDVQEIRVTNRGSRDCTLCVAIGFEPLAADTSAADTADEPPDSN